MTAVVRLLSRLWITDVQSCVSFCIILYTVDPKLGAGKLTCLISSLELSSEKLMDAVRFESSCEYMIAGVD